MEVCYKKMTTIEEDLKEFLDLLLETKMVLLQLKRYKGNPNYKKSFLDKTNKINRSYKFLKAKIDKDSNQKLKKAFNKISGDIETITKYKNPDSSLEEINYIEEHWPDIEITLEEGIGFTERIYDKGSRFDFYLDIKEIFNKAKKNLLIVDSWVNEDLLELYLKNLSKSINIRVLAGANPKGNLVKVGNIFKSQHGNLEVRENLDIHDRGIFCDLDNGWVMGQSIKDGAKKPTYLIQLREPKKLKEIYDRIWQQSKKIV